MRQTIKQKIIIDTDPGIDDAMAIHMAFADPRLDVLGLTTIFGNVTIDIATRNALVLAEMAHYQTDISKGATTPRRRPIEPPADFVHGAEGFGDVTVRMKWNLWGNDGGDTAFALFPFVKIPTGAGLGSDSWEGGLILPFGTTLDNGLSLGLMAEIDVVEDGGGNHDFEFLHSAVIGFDLTEELGLDL